MTTSSILSLARAALADDAKATPGPWIVPPDSYGDGEVYTDEPYKLVATTGRHPIGENQSFIAAARTREPELARWIERVLDDRSGFSATTHREARETMSSVSHMIDGGVAYARSLAAALLRAADEGEKEGM